MGSGIKIPGKESQLINLNKKKCFISWKERVISSPVWQGRSTYFSACCWGSFWRSHSCRPISPLRFAFNYEQEKYAGVPLERWYEGCWNALCLFTEEREQILCMFQGRSMPSWLHLPQMLQSYLAIHCIKCSLNLLYASPFVSPFISPPKQPSYLLNQNLFNTQ